MVFAVLTAFGVNTDPIDTSLTCLVHFLREQNLDCEVFNSTEPATEPISEACTRRIVSEKEAVYMVAYNKYEEKAEYKKFFGCFIDGIKNRDDFKNLLMMKNAVELHKLTWKARMNPKNWLPGKKKKAIKEIDVALDAIEFESVFSCEYKKKIEESFDSILRNPYLTGVHECMKKFQLKSSDAHNCGDALNQANSEIFDTNRNVYMHNKKSFRKCVSTDLKRGQFYMPAYIARTTEMHREEGKKVYIEEMLKMFKKAVDKCRKN